MPAMLEVAERGRTLAFSFEDVLKYHGGESPGGAAIAFKALECALPLLDPDRPPARASGSCSASATATTRRRWCCATGSHRRVHRPGASRP